MDIGGWTHHTVGGAGDSDTSSLRGPGGGVKGRGHGLPHSGALAGECVFYSEGKVQTNMRKWEGTVQNDMAVQSCEK